jgi:thiamine-phosphate pyrophosphorylase
MRSDSGHEVYRIIDASLNRAGEGIRTLEEYARFVLDDAELTAQFKSLRHRLTASLSPLPRRRYLQARDTPSDVGTHLSIESERRRNSLSEVIAAAATRTQQSLRCLEEYGKTIDPAMAADLEQVRYAAYTLCQQLELSVIRRDRTQSLWDARVYVLIDAAPTEANFVRLVRTLADGGADMLQLRDSTQDDRTLYERARIGAAIAREHRSLFIVNDRADIAAAAETDGVHVGQEELPAAAARQLVGPDRLVGVSTHGIAEVRGAVAEGADYIGCGPTFPGNTKSFDDFPGTDFLREVADEAIPIPWFAIGGITPEKLPEVIDAGCRRIAVTGAVRDADDPVASIAALKRQLREDPRGSF